MRGLQARVPTERALANRRAGMLSSTLREWTRGVTGPANGWSYHKQLLQRRDALTRWRCVYDLLQCREREICVFVLREASESAPHQEALMGPTGGCLRGPARGTAKRGQV